MPSKQRRPAQRGRRTGRKKLRYENRPFQSNTAHTEISTFLAKKIFHDIYTFMEQKPVPLAHLRGGRRRNL